MVNVDVWPITTGLGEKDLLRLAPGRLVNVADVACGLEAPSKVVTAANRNGIYPIINHIHGDIHCQVTGCRCSQTSTRKGEACCSGGTSQCATAGPCTKTNRICQNHTGRHGICESNSAQ